MTTARCPNYGHCIPIPGLQCDWPDGCLIYRLDQRVGDICKAQEGHTLLHETMNGDLREIVDWVRWARQTVKGLRWSASILISLGVIGAAITVVVRFLSG